MSDFHAFCKFQVMRFGGRTGWVDPKENAAPVADLVAALERGARGNSSMAKRIADACVEDSRYCPTVPDILRVAQEFHDQENTGPKFGFVGCEACDFSGWRAAKDHAGNDCSVPCGCRVKHQAGEARPPDGGRASKASDCDARMRQAGER